MALDVSCRDDGSADHRWWDRRRWEKRPIRDAQTRLRVSQVKPQLDVSWWSVSCIEHACLPVIVHICPGTQILVSWRVTTMRIYRMWGSKACQASDRRLWCLTSVCYCITSAVHPWIEFRAQPQCKILFWWYECHPSMWRDQPNGTELTSVSPQFLSCCRHAGLQFSGSCPAIIYERWGVSSARETGSVCCDDTRSTIRTRTEGWLGCSEWQKKQFKDVDLWIIYYLACVVH